MSHRQPFKIIQWATGAMGRSCMRAVIDRPDTELVGLYVYGQSKEGKDAGDIVYRKPTGVAATRNIDEILALEADVVVHCARIQKDHEVHDADILKLLKSGKNVISINGNTCPSSWSDMRRNAFKAACMEGNSSFMGAGLNPGFIAEKLLATTSSICTRIDAVEVNEIVVAAEMKSPEYVFDILGFGSDPDSIRFDDGSYAASVTLNGMYDEVIAVIASHYGWALDSVEHCHRVLPAPRDLTIAAGSIKKGQVSHVDWRWRGIVGGVERIALNIAWAMDPEYTGENPDLWTLNIQGEPNVSLALTIERPADMPGRTSPEQMALGGSVANAIPYVVAAPPGLLIPDFPTPYHTDTQSDLYLEAIGKTFKTV